MPRKSVPAYCHHKASGQGYVKIDGKRVYLGKHGTAESHRRYSEEIARWQNDQTEQTENVTIKQLTLLFIKRCEKHYQKNGKATSEFGLMQFALRRMNRLYKDELADKFTPPMLARVRQGMLADDYARTTINGYIRRIVQCFKWGVSQSLIRVTTWQALTTLQGLQAGRCGARETEPVKPVKLKDVEAVKPHIAEPLWGVIQFQLSTAARPSEALNMRVGEIDRSGPVWIYRPGSHKTQHHGKGRIILVGPKGQEIITEHVTTANPEAFVFAAPGSDGKKPYRRDSYRNGIKRACESAFGMPADLRYLNADAPVELREMAAEWRKANCWAPSQLRHSAATLIRKSSDVETAQILLGHSSLNVTEIYAERDLEKAASVIQQIG